MLVRFDKGIKAVEYALDNIPRIGDIVQVEQEMQGVVERVTWTFNLGDAPVVTVVLG